MSETDADLVERFRSGDSDAFETLIHRYARLVTSIAYGIVRDGHTAEDVAQDAFFKVQRGIGGLRDPDRFRSWLSGIARTTAIDWVRRARRGPGSLSALADTAGELPDTRSETAVAVLEGAERRARVRQELENLPDRYREVVMLKYLEGLSYKEIAEVTDLTTSAIESKLHRAREELRKRLKGLL